MLVLTSLHLSTVSKHGQLSNELSLTTFGRTDVYFYQEDTRRPATVQALSWTNIPASILGGFLLELRHGAHWKSYSRNHINYIFFNKDNNQANYRLEAGLSFLGEKALGSFFIAHERYFDDTSRPYPQPSSVLYIGLRTNSNAFF